MQPDDVLPLSRQALYAVYHGPNGLKDIATRVHKLAVALRSGGL